MPNPIPLQMRRAALDAYDRGEGTLEDIARIFGVSTKSLSRWRALAQCGEDLAPQPHSGGRSTQKIFQLHRDAIQAWLEEKPDLFNHDLTALLHREFGLELDPSQLSRILAQMGWTRKKNLHRPSPKAWRCARLPMGLQAGDAWALGPLRCGSGLGG